MLACCKHEAGDQFELRFVALAGALLELGMPTLTIRNVPARVVRSLKSLARRNRRSMEQEVREMLEGYVAERESVLNQIEAGWAKQSRRPAADEVDSWISLGRA